MSEYGLTPEEISRSSVTPRGLPFECVHCGRKSWHPVDRAKGYCGFCHHFCADLDKLNGYPLNEDA